MVKILLLLVNFLEDVIAKWERDCAGSSPWPLQNFHLSLSSSVPRRLTSLDCFAHPLLSSGYGWVWSMESTSRTMEHGIWLLLGRVLWMVISLAEGNSSCQGTLSHSSSSLFWLHSPLPALVLSDQGVAMAPTVASPGVLYHPLLGFFNPSHTFINSPSIKFSFLTCLSMPSLYCLDYNWLKGLSSSDIVISGRDAWSRIICGMLDVNQFWALSMGIESFCYVDNSIADDNISNKLLFYSYHMPGPVLTI